MNCPKVELTVTVDETFKDSSCNGKTTTVVISREGGMKIICTGQKSLIADLEKKEKNGWEISARLQPPKAAGRSVGRTYVDVGHSFVDGGIVFTFLPLCKDATKTKMPCDILPWTIAQLALEIKNPSDSSAYSKLILNNNIVMRQATNFRLARIEQQASNQHDRAELSWYKLIEGKAIEDKYHFPGLNPKSTYLKLHLAHTEDNNNIKNQMDTMSYWKDHFTLVFAIKAGSTSPAEVKHFISNEHKSNNAIRNSRLPVIDPVYSSREFDSISVHQLEEDDKSYPYYEIYITYKSPEDHISIPWHVAFSQFKIGEFEGESKGNEIPGEIQLKNPWLILGISIAATVLVIVIIVVVLCCRKVKSNVRKRTQDKMSMRYQENQRLIATQKANIDPKVKFDEFVKLFKDQAMASEMNKLYIPANEIERTGRKLGKGQFGIATVATYRGREVCIKTCRIEVDLNVTDVPPIGEYNVGTYNGDESSAGYGGSINSVQFKINEELFKDIFTEALQMKGFEHENVMKVIGVSLDANIAPEIILPLMDQGDLLTYVRNENNVCTYKNVRLQLFTKPIILTLLLGYQVLP